jgi:hypothetical protein
VILYWLVGSVFPSEIMDLIRLQEQKYCVSYVLMIHLWSFVLQLHVILVNNFQCKIVQ